MVLAAAATLGVVGIGVVGISQFASADRSDDASLASDRTADDTADETADDSAGGDESTADADDGTTDDDSTGDDTDDDHGSRDGRIVIDLGDGEPIEIDLGALDDEAFDRFRECAGLPDFGAPFDLPPIGDRADGLDDLRDRFERRLDELDLPPIGDLGDGDPRLWPSDDHVVTVLGPDGVTVIDLGEGDGSVTITQRDGELEITTDGEATVGTPGDIFDGPFGHLGDLDLGDLDLGDLDLGDLDLGDLDLGELDLGDLDLGELGLPDPDVIEECLAELN